MCLCFWNVFVFSKCIWLTVQLDNKLICPKACQTRTKNTIFTRKCKHVWKHTHMHYFREDQHQHQRPTEKPSSLFSLNNVSTNIHTSLSEVKDAWKKPTSLSILGVNNTIAMYSIRTNHHMKNSEFFMFVVWTYEHNDKIR
jgi:hypothetical protein